MAIFPLDPDQTIAQIIVRYGQMEFEGAATVNYKQIVLLHARLTGCLLPRPSDNGDGFQAVIAHRANTACMCVE